MDHRHRRPRPPAPQVDIGCVSAEEQAEALNECSILASMNHPNVIQCACSPRPLQPIFGD
jgi:hypothetical protein